MKKLLFVLLFALIATPAMAQTLGEKKAKADWEKAYNESTTAADFSKACGYDLAVTVDDNTMTPFIAGNANPYGYCKSVIDEMASMCGDALSKEAIAAKVKAVHCAYKEGDEEGTFALDGDKLNVTFQVGTSNIGDKTKTFLENNL